MTFKYKNITIAFRSILWRRLFKKSYFGYLRDDWGFLFQNGLFFTRLNFNNCLS